MSTFDYYRRIGAALFPISAGSKNPILPERLVPSFAHDWSRDPEQWARWRAEHPGCNFGIVAFATGMVIADIDTKKDPAAWTSWCRLCREWNVEPIMPQVQTPSGGYHVYMRLPAGVNARELRQPTLEKCIDLRVVGFTVCAGSHYAGDTAKGVPPGDYRLVAGAADADLPIVPQALIDVCLRQNDPVAPVKSKQGYRADQVAALLDEMFAEGLFDDQDDWLHAMMAIRAEFGDDPGEQLARRITWQTCIDANEFLGRWQSFDIKPTPGGKTMLSIFRRAHDAGIQHSVQRTSEAMFGDAIAEIAALPAPAPSKMILSSAEFVSGFTPPDYLIDGIFQRGFCYSITGKTGTGKTAVKLTVAAHIEIMRPLGKLEVAGGRVLYLAGENPTDIRMRWLGLTHSMGLDPDKLRVHFIDGAFKLSEIGERIYAETVSCGFEWTMIAVDTSAAFSESDDENDNIQAGRHARMMRSLCTFPGNPTVLVGCHPTKRAGDDDLIPRGGGAFLAEVDGNVALRRQDNLIVASALGKFRGPEFAPLSFELETVTHPRLIDSRGRPIKTVIAKHVTMDGAERLEAQAEVDADRVLRAIDRHPRARLTDLAKDLGWFLRDGSPHHMKVKRAAVILAKAKLVEERRDRWALTAKGQKELNETDARISVPPIPPGPANWPRGLN